MEKAQAFHCYASGQARSEAAMLRRRLAANPADAPPDPDESAARAAVSAAQGIALSGGGIRSATFNLGLLQALAQHGRLKEFDFLSTVSGGGYIGSFLGRLYHRAARELQDAAPAKLAAEVETVLSRDGSPLVRWLRDNGRYLAPRGLKDELFALGIYCRNFLTLHVLLGVTLLALFLGWAALRLWLSAAMRGPGSAFSFGYAPDGSSWSPAWIGVLVFAALVFAVAWAYWMRRKAAWMGLQQQVIALAVFTLAALALGEQLPGYINDITGRLPPPLIFAALLVSGGAVAAGLLAGPGANGDLAAVRNRLSSWLRAALAGLGAIALLALIDDGSYHAVLYFGKAASSRNALIGAGITGALLAGLRAFAQALAVRQDARLIKRPGSWLALLINVAGFALLALVAFGWAFAAMTYAMNSGGTDTMPVAVAAGLMATLVLLAGRQLDVLNLSSLHAFYAARLARAYLGPGNAARGLPWSVGTMRAPGLAAVSKVVAGDDIAWSGYAPHQYGGPLHLLNVNVNQTRYSAGGDFQPDRKGWNMALGPAGYNLGRSRWEPANWANADSLGLGQWMAVSGAAFTTGAGPRTGLGFSALLGLLGIRLGYWWRAGDDSVPKAQPHMLRALWEEITGAFNPDRSTHWYLSDGGHFENTAAYELIRRRVKRIVVADCGADARYEFDDLSALVLKARIDFGAEIEFFGNADLDALWSGQPGIRGLYAAPEAIVDRNGPGLLLALVRYPGDDVPGWVVVVKPRLPARLPADLAHYAEGELDFPQQSTLDQFYDEAQWESAHKLGRMLGDHLAAALGALPQVSAGPAGFKGAARLGKPAAAAPPETADSGSPANLIKIYAPIVIALWTGFQFYSDWQQEQAKSVAESTKFALSRIDVLERQVFGKDGCAMAKSPLAVCPTVPAQTVLVRGVLGDLPPGKTAQTLKEITDKIDDALKIGKPPAAVTVAAAIESGASAQATALLPKPAPRGLTSGAAPEQITPEQLSRALVYIQIYSEDSRPEAMRIVARLQQAGLKSDQLPGVENASRTAQAVSAKSPARFDRPTVIYYHAEDRPLAELIGHSAVTDPKQSADLRDLSKRYPDVRRGLAELWLP